MVISGNKNTSYYHALLTIYQSLTHQRGRSGIKLEKTFSIYAMKHNHQYRSMKIFTGKRQGSICHDEKVAYRPFLHIPALRIFNLLQRKNII